MALFVIVSLIIKGFMVPLPNTEKEERNITFFKKTI